MPLRFVSAVLAGLLAVTITSTSPAGAAEPVGPLPTPADFVTQHYEDFLSRPPDDAGLNYWTAVLADGAEPTALVEWLVESDEFAGSVAPLIRLYQAHFLRAPDHEGVQHWAEARRNGWSLERISEEFVTSEEFTTRYGTLDDAAYVERVYANVLGRAPDADGARYWEQQLASGMTRGELMAAFSDAPEYRDQTDARVKATMLYVGMLRRTADPVGLDYWAAELDEGTPYRNVIAGFLGNDEYIERIDRIYAEHHPLTGVPTRQAADRPALAVKIDNVDRARPQTGIDRADLVYEEMVEGNLTRLIAVFHSDVPAQVGPVRSVRTTDIHVLDQLNTPLLAASGANAGVLAAVDEADLVNVNALAAGGAYYRRSGRRAPHNMYADTAALYAAAGDNGGIPPALFDYRAPGEVPSNSIPAPAGVSVAFGRADIDYAWSARDRGWRRSQNRTLHKTAEGRQIAPENVVVLEVTYGVSPADAASPEANTVGSGVAHVFTAGRRVTGTWSRATSQDPIKVVDADGSPILLTRGRTFVELAPPGSIRLR